MTALQDKSTDFDDHLALLNLGELAVRLGTNVGFLNREYAPDDDRGAVVGAAVVVIDAADPAHLLEYRVEIPGNLGNVGLFSDSLAIYTTHYEPLAADPSRVRFYLDRITPQVGAPPTLTQLQIPGAILALGPKPGQLLTVDYRRQSSGFTHEIQLVDIAGDQVQILSRLQLQDGEHPGQLALGDDVLFIDLHPKYPGEQVTLLSGLSSGTIQRSDVALPSPARERAFVGLKAQGKRGVLVVNDQLLLVDATNSSVTELALVPGGESLQLDNDAAYLIAYSGLERFALPAP